MDGGSSPSTDPTSAQTTATASATPDATRGSNGASNTLARADTEVVVLNGTTITGLAARVSDQIAGAGFRTGTPNTFTDQARSASVVFYASNRARRQALALAGVLNISDVQPIVDSAEQLAPGADVVVVVGADQSP